MSVLSVKDVTVRFGGLVANDAISFDVSEGMLAAVGMASWAMAAEPIRRAATPAASAARISGTVLRIGQLP